MNGIKVVKERKILSSVNEANVLLNKERMGRMALLEGRLAPGESRNQSINWMEAHLI
jgi:hypothetical protein